MNINERIKHVRKSLDLNQGEFGERIKLKQGAISKMEQDGSTVTDQNIRMICETFNVTETWLRTGEGPQQRETREALLSKLAEQYSLSPDGVDIIRAVLSLSPSEWDAAVGIIRSLATSLAGDHIGGADKMATIEKSSTVAPTNEDSSAVAPHLRDATKMVDIDKEVAAYRAELEAQQKGPSRSAGTADKRA